MASITGYGPLQPFFDDPTVEEIWINAPTRVFVARDGVAELTTVVLSDREVRELVERMLQHSGRRVDLSSPFVDASLPDGSRLHVVDPRRDPGALGGEHPQVPARIRSLRAARRARLAAAAGGGVPAHERACGREHPRLRGHAYRQDDPAQRAHVRRARRRSRRHRRGDVRARSRRARPRRDAVPPAEPRGHRRDHAAPPHQGGAAHATRPARGRRGA